MNKLSTTQSQQYPLLQALAGERADRTPIWFMRQAGRYLPEYRALRTKHALLKMMCEPELAAEITLQPIRRFDLDAAIIFADILTPLMSLGVDLDFIDGEGPRLGLKKAANGAPVLVPQDTPVADFTCQALSRVRKELAGTKTALIGFCGAPFTSAAYLLEESIGSRKDLATTKKFMRSEPLAWKSLQKTLVDHLSRYLLEQVEAGAQAVQIFDSWIGGISPSEFEQSILPHLVTLVANVRKKSPVPIIYFGLANHGHLSLLSQLGVNCIGVDWTIKLTAAHGLLEKNITLQGNLDPTLLLPGNDLGLRAAVEAVLEDAEQLSSFVFNVGHGLQPTTQIGAIEAVIQIVRTSQQGAMRAISHR